MDDKNVIMDFSRKSNNASSSSSNEDDSIDILEIFAVLNRYKWRIVILTVLITSIVTAIVFSMTPIYESKATMLIEKQEAKYISIEDVMGLDGKNDEYLQTQFEILKSRKIAGRVVDKLGLIKHPEFAPPEPSLIDKIKRIIPIDYQSEYAVEQDPEKIRREQVIDKLIDMITITPINNTQLVNIVVESHYPELSAKIANGVGNAYMFSYMEDSLANTRQATSWLNDRLHELKIQLRQAEHALQDYREKEDIVDIEGLLSLEQKNFTDITTRLSDARKQRTQIESLMTIVKQHSGASVDELATLKEISSHPLMGVVRREEADAEQHVAELSERYGPKHSKMIAAKARLKEAQAAVKRQLRELVDGLSQEYEAALTRERSLEAEFKRERENYQRLSRKETRYRELKRNVDTNRQLYDAFLKRMKETGIVDEFQGAVARFTDKAQMPLTPAKPNKKLTLAVALLASLLFSSILAYLSNMLNDTIFKVEEVENKLAQRVMGVVPESKNLPDQAHITVDADDYGDKHSAYIEAWRELTTSLLLNHMGTENKVFAVTSSIPGEGKSTSASHLAASLAKTQSVILIEADMRKPSLFSRFGVPKYQPGLANLIGGTHNLEKVIVHDEKTGLDLITAGGFTPNPHQLLSTGAFAVWLEQLKERYDKIVVDTPPVNAVSDPLLVAKHADSTLYVVRANSTPRKQILTGLGRLNEVHARIDGVILNRVNTKTIRSYYGGTYGDYYGEHSTPIDADETDIFGNTKTGS